LPVLLHYARAQENKKSRKKKNLLHMRPPLPSVPIHLIHGRRIVFCVSGHLHQYLLFRGQGDTASIHVGKQLMTKSLDIVCEYQLIKTAKTENQLIVCKSNT
jgi:hypothetical protein